MLEQIDIKKLRKGRRLTQEQLGIMSGMAKSQICRMEKGLLGSPETYARVLGALGYELFIEARQINPVENEKDTILRCLSSYKQNNSEKYGIDVMGLLGSFAREEQTPSSDIDIVLHLKRPSLYKYSAIQADLQTLFKRDVDIVSTGSRMNESFKQQLEKDAIYV